MKAISFEDRDARIAELTAEIDALRARAEELERDNGILKKQLANCHETMRKDGVRHAKALLALEDDTTRIYERDTLLMLILDEEEFSEGAFDRAVEKLKKVAAGCA